MKKVVFFGWKAPSSFNVILPIIEALMEHNIEIHYFGFGIYKNVLEKKGVNFYEYTYEDDIHINIIDNISIYTQDEMIKNSYQFDKELFSYFKRMAEENYEIVKSINPDIIFRDYNALNGKILASKLKIKSVGINTTITILNEDIRKNPLELFGLYNCIDLSKMKDIKDNFYEEMIKNNKKLCEELDLPYMNPVYNIDGEDDINICFGGSDLQSVRDNDFSKYVIVKHPLRKISNSWSIESEKIDINFNNNNPLIYVSSGLLINGNNELYNTIIKLANKNNYNVIISIPTMDKMQKNIGENVKVFGIIDQQYILSNSDLFISTGGFNSICESIEFKVPLLITPYVNDQFTNADLIKKLEIGESYINKDINESDLDTIIKDLLDNAKYKENIARIKYNCNNSVSVNDIIENMKSGELYI